MIWPAPIEFAEAPFKIIDGDRGKNYPKQSDFYTSGHCLFLSATNVTKTGFDFSSCLFIDEQKDAALNKGKLQREDIVLTTRGTLGNTAYFNDTIPFENLRINSGMVIFRCDRAKILPSFLYHFVRSPSFHAQVNSLRSGAAQPQLPIRDMRRIRLPFPPLEEQRRIAGILSAYDELIENSQRRIQILEKMTRALYREWFVQFKFPGHEKAKITNGLPDGWKMAPILHFGKVITGKTPSKAKVEFYGDDVPFVKTPAMHGNMFLLATTDRLSKAGAESQANKTLPAGSICVSCIGTIGVVSITTEDCQTNQQINSVLLNNATTREFLFLRLKDAKQELENLGSSGATMGNVNKGKFEAMEVVCPPDDLLSHYHQLVEPMFSEILSLLRKIQNLRQTRDLLLPRLLNGDVKL